MSLPIHKIFKFNDLDEQLDIFRQYAYMLQYVPVDKIKRDVDAFGRIENEGELKKALKLDPAKARLSYAHSMSYSYAEARCNEIESNPGGSWHHSLIPAIDLLCLYGDPSKIKELKERWNLFKATRS